MTEENGTMMVNKLKERRRLHSLKFEEKQREITSLGYTDKMLDIIIEAHPVIEILISREMFWSRCRECEEAIKIVRGDNELLNEKEDLENQGKFDKGFWAFNCPVQMFPLDNGTWRILNYMPRKERIVELGKTVTKEELPGFCKNTAHILRNLANLFDALGDGKIDTIYYPDEKVEEAILEKEVGR